MSTIRQIARRFGMSREGNVSVMMCLGMLSLLGATGIGVDYAQVMRVKTDVFAAADAAALAGARTYGTPAEREKAARVVFEANTLALKGLASVAMFPENVVRDGANYGYRVGATATVKTSFGKMFGVDNFSAKVLAEAIGAISSNTEIALVLDSTYSMTGWKMNTLKQAAVQMVDDLDKITPQKDQLKFSLVPFSEYVNVGLPNRKKGWINVPDDYKDPDRQVCNDERSVIGEENCRTVTEPASPGSPPQTCYNDGVPYSCGGSPPRPARTVQVCDKIYGPTQRVCRIQTGDWHRWYGCVGSRNHPLDTKDSDYINKVPGLLDLSCGTPLQELTDNRSSIKNAIRALNPNGETYIPAGLIWGWRTLSAQEPFLAGTSSASAPVRKYIVLMTDGLNTRSPTYPYHFGNDGAKSNALTKTICANIAADKASAIQIHSVAFDVRDAATKAMLKDCATKTGGLFFDARNSTEFMAAFAKIGTTIAGLRLSK